jgi:cell division septal protein FtsQ
MFGMTKKRRSLPTGLRRNRSGFDRVFFYFLSVIFLGTFVYILFFSQFLTIFSIEISGNRDIGKQPILEEVNSYLNGKYLGIIDKKNLVLANRDRIRKKIISRFKQIKNVEIKKNFPSGLEINIQERKISLAVLSGGNCYVLDENGEPYDIFSCDGEEIKRNNLIIMEDRSGKPVEIGKTFLEKDYMDYVLNIRKNIEEMVGLKIENNFKTPNFISGDIRVRTGGGWEIYFNREIILEREMEMLELFLSNQSKEVSSGNVEYADLRSDGKIYYKLKNNEEPKIQEEIKTEKNNSTKDKNKSKDKKNKA